MLIRRSYIFFPLHLRFKMIEFAEQKMSASLPKPLALSNVAIRMLFQSGTSSSVLFEDTISTSASSSSSSSSSNNSYKALMSVVGGVLYLDLAEFPELPKTVDTWTIRQSKIILSIVIFDLYIFATHIILVLSPSGGLKRLAYPFKKLVTDQADDDETNADAAITWPTLVTYHIPPETFLNPSNATVRYYNDETKSWEDDNITDVEIDQGRSHEMKGFAERSRGSPIFLLSLYY